MLERVKRRFSRLPIRLERGQAQTEYALVLVLVGVACIVVLFWVGAGTARVFERFVCAFDYTQCPTGPLHDGDERCISEEQITPEYAYCNGDVFELSLVSSCPNTQLELNGTPLLYDPFTNRHSWDPALDPPNCPGSSDIGPGSLISNRANGTSASSAASIPVD